MPKRSCTILIYITLFLLSFSLTGAVYAFPSSSTNYKLEGEFGDFGGSKSSASYSLTDTGGGFAPGFGDSISYRNCSGFQCTLAQVPSITLSISTNAISLLTLSTGSVNSQSNTATVTTNLGGYSLKVVQDDNLCRATLPCSSVNDIDAVVSSPIVANTEAYGIATSKSGQDIIQDTVCGSAPFNASSLSTTPQSVASSSSPTGISGDTVTVCYAAAIHGATAAGNYSQKVTYIATGTF